MRSSEPRAQSLTDRTEAAARKWGCGEKNVGAEASARRRIVDGSVLEKAWRRSGQEEAALVKSSMLDRQEGRRKRTSRGRAVRDILAVLFQEYNVRGDGGTEPKCGAVSSYTLRQNDGDGFFNANLS